jgi:RNA polymerase sigma-70 factor (ECF subfamily)
MADHPQAAFGLIDQLAPELDSYHLFHATRADLFRRVGVFEEATQSYRRALELVTNDSERRFLKRRLREVQS